MLKGAGTAAAGECGAGGRGAPGAAEPGGAAGEAVPPACRSPARPGRRDAHATQAQGCDGQTASGELEGKSETQNEAACSSSPPARTQTRLHQLSGISIRTERGERGKQAGGSSVRGGWDPAAVPCVWPGPASSLRGGRSEEGRGADVSTGARCGACKWPRLRATRSPSARARRSPLPAPAAAAAPGAAPGPLVLLRRCRQPPPRRLMTSPPPALLPPCRGMRRDAPRHTGMRWDAMGRDGMGWDAESRGPQ